MKTAAGAAITFINGDRKLLYGNGTTLCVLPGLNAPDPSYDIGGAVGGTPAQARCWCVSPCLALFGFRLVCQEVAAWREKPLLRPRHSL